MAKQTTGDLEYVNKRNRFIFSADRLARQRMFDEPYDKDRHAYEFSKAMTELTEEAGLISKGNVELFNAKKLPGPTYYGE